MHINKKTEKSEYNVEIFKFFEKSKISKVSKSTKQPKRKSPIIIKPQMRKTRLKSEIFIENMRCVSPDGEYDIAKEDFDDTNFTNKKSYDNTPKSDKINKSKPSLRRSIRLKSQVFDRSFLNVTEVCENSEEDIMKNTTDTPLTGDDAIPNGHLTNKRTERKLSCHELADDFFETIDTNVIADLLTCSGSKTNSDMLALTDADNGKEDKNACNKQTKDIETLESVLTVDTNIIEMLALTDGSADDEYESGNPSKKLRMETDNSESSLCNKRKKNKKSEKKLKKKRKLTETENLNLENNTNHNSELNDKESNANEMNSKQQSSLKIINNQNSPTKENDVKELNESVSNAQEVENVKEVYSRKTRSSSEFTKNATTRHNSPAKETNKGAKNSNKVLNSSTTKTSKSNGILNYFSVQNKNNEKLTKKQNEQHLENNLDNNSVSNDLQLDKTNVENNEDNGAKTPTQPKRRRGRPPLLGKGRPPLAKQRVNKINVSKPACVKKYTKLSKLTKEQIKKMGARKIPKDRLDDVLNMIEDDSHPIWDDRNISCNSSIFQYWNPRSALNSDQNIKLKYARQFLLRRDWLNLSKVLGLFNTTAKIYYPLLSKYAALLLAHTDKEQFSKFIQCLTKMNDSSSIMKKCTNITIQKEEET